MITLKSHYQPSVNKRLLNGGQYTLVETLMFRFKTIMGRELRSKIWENQVTEAMVKLQALNKMTELGMPESYKIAG